MAKTESERRDYMVTQANLAALHQHPSWDALEAEIERLIKGIEASVIARVLHGKGMSIAEQAYDHGRVAGLRVFLRQPAQAQSRLDRFVGKNGIDQEEDDGA